VECDHIEQQRVELGTQQDRWVYCWSQFRSYYPVFRITRRKMHRVTFRICLFTNWMEV